MIETTYQVLQGYYTDRGFTVEESIFRSYSLDDNGRSHYRTEYDGFNQAEEDAELLAIFDRLDWGN